MHPAESSTVPTPMRASGAWTDYDLALAVESTTCSAWRATRGFCHAIQPLLSPGPQANAMTDAHSHVMPRIDWQQGPAGHSCDMNAVEVWLRLFQPLAFPPPKLAAPTAPPFYHGYGAEPGQSIGTGTPLRAYRRSVGACHFTSGARPPSVLSVSASDVPPRCSTASTGNSCSIACSILANSCRSARRIRLSSIGLSIVSDILDR